MTFVRIASAAHKTGTVENKMLAGYGPVTQALLGTVFTWFLTAAGSALVFICKSSQRRVLDGSLGFAAGVMTAASYWSLLAPAIEMAEESGDYGADGEWAFVPVAIGFTLGALFVFGADILMPQLGLSDPAMALALESSRGGVKSEDDGFLNHSTVDLEHNDAHYGSSPGDRDLRQRGGVGTSQSHHPNLNSSVPLQQSMTEDRRKTSWKRILLLIVAITIHNIPEGVAVGVGFGAIGRSTSATFDKARNLAVGIGLQNFPEGLAVSLPLRGSGMSPWRAFWYGQLSGVVEPVAGVLGALAVSIATPLLPYALAFAAGAMIYVVVDDIIPESQTCGNGKLASWGCVLGFVVMMCMDVGLG